MKLLIQSGLLDHVNLAFPPIPRLRRGAPALDGVYVFGIDGYSRVYYFFGDAAHHQPGTSLLHINDWDDGETVIAKNNISLAINEKESSIPAEYALGNWLCIGVSSKTEATDAVAPCVESVIAATLVAPRGRTPLATGEYLRRNAQYAALLLERESIHKKVGARIIYPDPREMPDIVIGNVADTEEDA